MKTIPFPRLILLCSLFASTCLAAQSGQLQDSAHCEPLPFPRQVDSLKDFFQKQGYQLVREASIEMQSGVALPLLFPLNQGSRYELVVLGDPEAVLREASLNEDATQQVVFRPEGPAPVRENILHFSFQPQFTEYRMIRPMQVHRTKNKLWGYFLFFKKAP